MNAPNGGVKYVKDLLYVLGLKKKLQTTSQILKKHSKIQYDGKGFIKDKRNKQKVVAEVVKGDLDRYRVTTIGKRAPTDENNSKNQLWNQRYGYLKSQNWNI